MARDGTFVRGINLGGRRAADKVHLASGSRNLAKRGVATFRAGGNVIFGADERGAPAPEIVRPHGAGLARSLGYDIRLSALGG